MADARIREGGTTVATLNLGSWKTDINRFPKNVEVLFAATFS
jgi:hypothetical protein